jgi:hypothetical protein
MFDAIESSGRQGDFAESLHKINKSITENNKQLIGMNKAIKQISKTIESDSLIVKSTTDLDGNCIFESFCQLGYFHDKQILRTTVAILLYEFREYKGFFPLQPDFTPKELFDVFAQGSEIKTVIDKDRMKVIDYTYEVMCRDLSCNGSWERMCADFVFMTLALMFDVQLRIYNDDSNIKVDYMPNAPSSFVWGIPKKKYPIVNIGYLKRYHYVPLIRGKTNEIVQYQLEQLRHIPNSFDYVDV